MAVIGGGFAGLIAGRAPAPGRHRRRAHHREGRRLRRHLVLEPISGRAVRRESYVYLPLLEETGTSRPRSTRTRPRSWRTAGASPSSSGYTGGPALHRGHPPRWDEGRAAGPSAPIAVTACGAFLVLGTGHSPARSCRVSRASRGSRATPSTPAVGITATRAVTPRRTWRPARQGCRRSSVRCHGGARRAAGGRGGAATSTCSSARRRRSTCGATGRPTSSGSKSPRPGWQPGADAELHHPHVGRHAPSEDLVMDGWTDIIGRARAALAFGSHVGSTYLSDLAHRGARNGRLRQNGADPLPGRRDRLPIPQPPRRS